MVMSDRAILVLTSLPQRAAAEALARHLLSARLAACVQIGQTTQSLYHWRGKIETADEVPLWIKTREDLYPAIEEAIRARHPYELPEIVAVPFIHAFAAYIDWIGSATAAADV